MAISQPAAPNTHTHVRVDRSGAHKLLPDATHSLRHVLHLGEVRALNVVLLLS